MSEQNSGAASRPREAREFAAGARVTVLRSVRLTELMEVPGVMTGTVTGLLADIDPGAALLRALWDTPEGLELAELEGIAVVPAADGSAQLSMELPAAEVAVLLASHRYYVVRVDGTGELLSFRPGELEAAGG